MHRIAIVRHTLRQPWSQRCLPRRWFANQLCCSVKAQLVHVLPATLQGRQPARRRVAVWRAGYSRVQSRERAGARGTCTPACTGQSVYSRGGNTLREHVHSVSQTARCPQIPGSPGGLCDGPEGLAYRHTSTTIRTSCATGGPEVHVQRQEPGDGVVCAQLLLPVRSLDML